MSFFNYTAGAVTVGTTATKIANADVNRKALTVGWVSDTGAVKVAVGRDNSVTLGNGFRLPPDLTTMDNQVTFKHYQGEIWAIADAASAQVVAYSEG